MPAPDVSMGVQGQATERLDTLQSAHLLSPETELQRAKSSAREDPAMTIGCHGLVWTGVFDEAGIRLAAEKTKQAGFDLIEYPLMDPFSFDAAAAKSAIDEHGLQVSASLGLSEATDISSEDPAVVAAGEALLLQAVDVLAEMGGTHFCGVIYSAMKKFMEPAMPGGIANSQRVIGRVADHAAERGVQVSVEVVNRYETNILNTS